MAVTKYGLLYDAVQGGSIEIGTLTLDPANLAADTSVEETVTLTGATTDDVLLILPQDITDGLVIEGAWISAADTATIQLHNTTESAVNGVSTTFSYLLLKVSAA